MKASELISGQFFSYLGMTCICDRNEQGGQPVRFGYWNFGSYDLRYCGAFCDVMLLPYRTWDEAKQHKVREATKIDMMQICAVSLKRQSGFLVVEVETVNGWIEVIREKDDGTTPVSHVCEASGLASANRDSAEQQSMNDLAASGGIRASF